MINPPKSSTIQHASLEPLTANQPDAAVGICNEDKPPSLVPIGLTIGLAIFAMVLGLAGFGFRLMFGESFADILPSLLGTMAIFWGLIPSGFVIGAKLLNRYSGKPPIQSRNALTLGLLFSCVAMLWLMSMYS